MDRQSAIIVAVASVLLPYARPELYRPPDPHKPVTQQRTVIRNNMTFDELKIARQLLAEHTDRTETIGADDGESVYLTAYWADGGQKLFYTLDQVREYLNERKRAKQASS